jgi:seryl-tRNA synthetase
MQVQNEFADLQRGSRVPGHLGGLTLKGDKARWSATYPFHIPPSTLKDNYKQVYRYTLAQERILAKQGQIQEFYAQFYKTVECDVFKEIGPEEMVAWNGPVNYISMVH